MAEELVRGWLIALNRGNVMDSAKTEDLVH